MDTNFQTLQELMPHRVRRILIVSSPYDAFVMEEDGGVLDHVFMRFRGISLVEPPNFTVVSNYEKALEIVEPKKFDLMVIMPRVLGVDQVLLGEKIKGKDPHLPVVLLAHSTKGVQKFIEKWPTPFIDELFVWSGNRTVLWTILKWVEDRLNVEHDTKFAVVQVLILIENDPVHYSSLLQMLYQSIVNQTKALQDETLNEEQRMLMLRGRSKILLAKNYEEGMKLYEKFKPHLFGIFASTRFQKDEKDYDNAGISFLKHVQSESPHVPVLLLGTSEDRPESFDIGASFLDKNSDSLHMNIKAFLIEHMGLGDFICRLPTGEEISRCTNIQSLERVLGELPLESIAYHVNLNHFSKWLLARSEVELATIFRDKKCSDFSDMEELRKYFIDQIHAKRMNSQLGIVSSISMENFDSEALLQRIGDGSFGGKARGLAFMAKYFHQNRHVFEKFKNVSITTPKTMIISTDYFDEFINDNGLQDFFEAKCTNQEVEQRFMKAFLPKNLKDELKIYLEQVKYPIAVRSSGLLEDNLEEAYAGLYATYMLANSDLDIEKRLELLSNAIKLVYASTFYEGAKAFSKATQHRVEEEKMAIILQQITGDHYGEYFYPAISGVARSRNFYPVDHMLPEEGIANIAVGFGKILDESNQSIRFSPKYPQHITQFSNVDNILKNSQKSFFALKICGQSCQDDGMNLVRRDVFDARHELPIQMCSSTYIVGDNIIRDYYSVRNGVPVLTFAHILKQNKIPIAEILSELFEIGKKGFGADLELEFAVNLPSNQNEKIEFVLLQIRPLVGKFENVKIGLAESAIKKSICYSTNALGCGEVDGISDMIFVKPEMFLAKNTVAMVSEISKLNKSLENQGRRYILVGPGRWGTADHCLGVPVSWNDISNVAVIVEAVTEDFRADPSHGTHFFQHITSLGIIYMTVYEKEDFLDWDWIKKQKPVYETDFISHIRIKNGFKIMVDGKKNIGVITNN